MQDSPPSKLPDSVAAERKGIARAQQLHWLHWTVIALSLVLTFAVWRFASHQLEDKVNTRFNREADRVIELVEDRMQKYEDALWGGVGAYQSHSYGMEHHEWVRFANSLSIGNKYPEINGIGVIYKVPSEELESFVAENQATRPGFTVHPPHSRKEHYVITYIEPVATNQKAVGLDVAFEENRYFGLLYARDTAEAAITGPIMLVQDAEQTPAFLFYAPFYEENAHASLEERREHFRGVVYAPFVVKNLMEGTLKAENRHVAFNIYDDGTPIYTEFGAGKKPEARHHTRRQIALYGRTWQFDIVSEEAFIAATASSQPTIILAGGLIIDSLLFILFVSLTRANRRTLSFADRVTSKLRQKQNELEISNQVLSKTNEELEQFAYIASHDLQEPLRTISSYIELIEQRYKDKLGEDGLEFMEFVTDGASRMKAIISDLLLYSRTSREEIKLEKVQMMAVTALAESYLQNQIERSNARIDIKPLPVVYGNERQLVRLLQNLISNAIKFRRENKPPQIKIYPVIDEAQPGYCRICVADNGIGIEKEYAEQVFAIFQRLHDRSQYEGTGIGLAVCKKIIEKHHGEIWLKSTPGEGTTFCFTLPVQPR